MRKLLMAVLAFAGASSMMMLEPVRVFANDGIVMESVPEKRVTRAARLKLADGSDPDTVWVGHIDDAGFDAGGKMVAGGYGPYNIGRGPAFHVRAGTPTTIVSAVTFCSAARTPLRSDAIAARSIDSLKSRNVFTGKRSANRRPW